MKQGKKFSIMLAALLLGSIVLTACGTGAPTPVPVSNTAPSATSEPVVTPDSPVPNVPPPVSTGLEGQALLQDRCTRCHSLERVTSAHKTADEWQTTVMRMINKGVQLNAQEQLTLVDYLSLNYR